MVELMNTVCPFKSISYLRRLGKNPKKEMGKWRPGWSRRDLVGPGRCLARAIFPVLLCMNCPFPNRLTHFYGEVDLSGAAQGRRVGVGATGLLSFERGACIKPLRDLGSFPNSEFSSPPPVPRKLGGSPGHRHRPRRRKRPVSDL